MWRGIVSLGRSIARSAGLRHTPRLTMADSLWLRTRERSGMTPPPRELPVKRREQPAFHFADVADGIALGEEDAVFEFFKPMSVVSTAEFTFKPQGNQTEVTWDITGKKDFM